MSSGTFGPRWRPHSVSDLKRKEDESFRTEQRAALIKAIEAETGFSPVVIAEILRTIEKNQAALDFLACH